MGRIEESIEFYGDHSSVNPNILGRAVRRTEVIGENGKVQGVIEAEVVPSDEVEPIIVGGEPVEEVS